MKHCYKLSISYDGSAYSGWQIQPNSLTIQELLQNTLKTILNQKVIVIASGRTDAGVHALEQIAHFHHEEVLDTKKLFYSLNGLLPKDVRILKLEEAEPNFHARFQAKGKIYRYFLYLNKVHSPFQKPYSLHISRPLDLDIMKKSSKHFLGTHNFKAFANKQDQGSAKHSPIKTIYSISISETTPKLYCIEIHGSGFLYKMVRNMVGTLIDCGLKKLSKDAPKLILESQDRKKASRAVPPHGLFLTKVFYN